MTTEPRRKPIVPANLEYIKESKLFKDGWIALNADLDKNPFQTKNETFLIREKFVNLSNKIKLALSDQEDESNFPEIVNFEYKECDNKKDEKSVTESESIRASSFESKKPKDLILTRNIENIVFLHFDSKDEILRIEWIKERGNKKKQELFSIDIDESKILEAIGKIENLFQLLNGNFIVHVWNKEKFLHDLSMFKDIPASFQIDTDTIIGLKESLMETDRQNYQSIEYYCSENGIRADLARQLNTDTPEAHILKRAVIYFNNNQRRPE